MPESIATRSVGRCAPDGAGVQVDLERVCASKKTIRPRKTNAQKKTALTRRQAAAGQQRPVDEATKIAENRHR